MSGMTVNYIYGQISPDSSENILLILLFLSVMFLLKAFGKEL